MSEWREVQAIGQVRRRLPRTQVLELQRSRILAAATEVLYEVGFARMTVGLVVSRARISRTTFYEAFPRWEGCFLAVLDDAILRTQTVVREAFVQEPCWQESIRAALGRLLVLFDRDRSLAKLLLVETLEAGGRALARRTEVLAQLATIIDQGRRDTRLKSEPPEVTAEVIVGGVIAVLHTRVCHGDDRPLIELHGSLMAMIVLPYLGRGAARCEALRPPLDLERPESQRVGEGGADSRHGLNMRLTYRTLRVLSAIGARAGASNREIAEASGVIDQGQISRLLTRLAGRRLIENRGAGQERGSANAWHLLPAGREIERFICSSEIGLR